VAGGLGFPAEVGREGLLTGGILGGDIQELPRHVRGPATEHVDECPIGHAVDEGADHVGVGDVWELIVLLGEVLNALPEGLVGLLPIVVEILGVPWVGVGTLEVVDEDRTEVAPAVDAAGLKLLEPSRG
jgi:hypothetical protein